MKGEKDVEQNTTQFSKRYSVILLKYKAIIDYFESFGADHRPNNNIVQIVILKTNKFKLFNFDEFA